MKQFIAPNMIKTCVICNIEFESPWCSKTCSKQCRLQHNNYRRIKTNKNCLKKFNCKFCNNEVIRYRIRSGFCGKSCASKYYIQNGVYDKWKNAPDRSKHGIYKNCLICKKQFYVKPHNIDSKNVGIFCSRKCIFLNLKEKFKGENNPAFGRKESFESKQKKINTLQKRYGVTNAFYLAKHKTQSKPQIEIFNFIKNEFLDKKVKKEFKIGKYLCDILIDKIVIEFNGTYWHCDPKIYKEDYFNKKKSLYAKDIWNYDNEKLNFIKSNGYKIIVIWEKEFNENKQLVLENLKRKINDG